MLPQFGQPADLARENIAYNCQSGPGQKYTPNWRAVVALAGTATEGDSVEGWTAGDPKSESGRGLTCTRLKQYVASGRSEKAPLRAALQSSPIPVTPSPASRAAPRKFRLPQIHLKIKQRNFSRFIMRRLRRTMYDQIKAVRSKEFFDSRSVADIQLGRSESLGHALQPLQIPERVTRGTKESSAHVVVYADNFMPLPVEMLDRLPANQSAAAGDKNLHPSESISLPAAAD